MIWLTIASSIFSHEIRNCVSIGLSRAKSRLPVRMSSLKFAQFGMKNASIIALINMPVAMKAKYCGSVQPLMKSTLS